MKKAIMLALAFVASAVFAEFKAGFARVDATPPLGIPIVGYFHKRVADGVLDPLNVECVAVSDGTNSALIYCVDDLGLGPGFTKKAFTAITAATGVPRERIYIHATHTHTGPSTWTSANFTKEENRLILQHVTNRIAKMAEAGKMALADMAPAKIGVAKTVCRNVSFIRRYRMKDGSVRTNPGITNPNVKEPLGTPDETLQLVRFRRTGAPDIAIVTRHRHRQLRYAPRLHRRDEVLRRLAGRRAQHVRGGGRRRREVPLPQRRAGRREQRPAFPAARTRRAER